VRRVVPAVAARGEERSSAEQRVPVVVVGGGPVGLMVALDLARHGVRSVLVNSGEAHRVFPKGNTHNARTMEHYRRLGLAGRVRAVGLPPGHATDVGYFTRLNGYELARIPMPSAREKLAAVGCDGAADQVPEPIHRANQMYVEAILLEHARGVPAIELRYGWRCVEFDDDGDTVRVVVERDADGRREELRGRYLVGCDGGQSFVRRRLGIRYEGEASLDQPFFGGAMVSTQPPRQVPPSMRLSGADDGQPAAGCATAFALPACTSPRSRRASARIPCNSAAEGHLTPGHGSRLLLAVALASAARRRGRHDDLMGLPSTWVVARIAGRVP
jgi:2-polyprenyl-6-methoxyphenol hydroxylase-like FAD-dependent oxidoreductase